MYIETASQTIKTVTMCNEASRYLDGMCYACGSSLGTLWLQ